MEISELESITEQFLDIRIKKFTNFDEQHQTSQSSYFFTKILYLFEHKGAGALDLIDVVRNINLFYKPSQVPVLRENMFLHPNSLWDWFSIIEHVVDMLGEFRQIESGLKNLNFVSKTADLNDSSILRALFDTKLDSKQYQLYKDHIKEKILKPKKAKEKDTIDQIRSGFYKDLVVRCHLYFQCKTKPEIEHELLFIEHTGNCDYVNLMLEYVIRSASYKACVIIKKQQFHHPANFTDAMRIMQQNNPLVTKQFPTFIHSDLLESVLTNITNNVSEFNSLLQHDNPIDDYSIDVQNQVVECVDVSVIHNNSLQTVKSVHTICVSNKWTGGKRKFDRIQFSFTRDEFYSLCEHFTEQINGMFYSSDSNNGDNNNYSNMFNEDISYACNEEQADTVVHYLTDCNQHPRFNYHIGLDPICTTLAQSTKNKEIIHFRQQLAHRPFPLATPPRIIKQGMSMFYCVLLAINEFNQFLEDDVSGSALIVQSNGLLKSHYSAMRASLLEHMQLNVDALSYIQFAELCGTSMDEQINYLRKATYSHRCVIFTAKVLSCMLQVQLRISTAHCRFLCFPDRLVSCKGFTNTEFLINGRKSMKIDLFFDGLVFYNADYNLGHVGLDNMDDEKYSLLPDLKIIRL